VCYSSETEVPDTEGEDEKHHIVIVTKSDVKYKQQAPHQNIKSRPSTSHSRTTLTCLDPKKTNWA
jgi:hypothetical protein